MCTHATYVIDFIKKQEVHIGKLNMHRVHMHVHREPATKPEAPGPRTKAEGRGTKCEGRGLGTKYEEPNSSYPVLRYPADSVSLNASKVASTAC